MRRIGQNTGNSGDIMVVHKIHQMFSAVNTPVLRTVLTVQRMSDFKKIHRIKTGINALVTFIIGTTMQHLVVDDQVVVAKQNLTDQGESWF